MIGIYDVLSPTAIAFVFPYRRSNPSDWSFTLALESRFTCGHPPVTCSASNHRIIGPFPNQPRDSENERRLGWSRDGIRWQGLLHVTNLLPAVPLPQGLTYTAVYGTCPRRESIFAAARNATTQALGMNISAGRCIAEPSTSRCWNKVVGGGSSVYFGNPEIAPSALRGDGKAARKHWCFGHRAVPAPARTGIHRHLEQPRILGCQRQYFARRRLVRNGLQSSKPHKNTDALSLPHGPHIANGRYASSRLSRHGIMSAVFRKFYVPVLFPHARSLAAQYICP